MNWLIILSSAIVSAILYRIGGWGVIPHNKLYRRLGCPLVFIIAFCLLAGLKLGLFWAYMLTFGFSYLAITTYHDYTGEDNFYLHGLGLGIAAFPLVFCGIAWYAILIRAVVLAVTMGVWSKVWGWDIAEETGRGALYILTIPLLMI